MTAARYLLGVVLLGVVLVPLGAGSRALRARLLPSWAEAPARLAEVVIGLAVVVCVAEALGVVGLFRRAPMVVGLGGAGAAAWLVGRQRRPSSAAGDARPRRAVNVVPNRLGRGALVVALVATALVVADWSARTVAALHHGMGTIDTLWYHLPNAARFVQDGSITSLHFVDPEPVVAFFPSNSALLHALGILFLGNDLLSPLLNLGWLALALLGAWCVGRPFGVAPVTLTGGAALLVTPGLVATQPGGGYNDVVGLALLLASVALLVNADSAHDPSSLAVLVVAALAAGLAIGTKFTFIVPVAALTLAVVVLAPRGARLRRGGAWVLAVGIVGGFWYARNLVATGNPLPGLDVPTSTLSDFLFDRDAVGQFVHPALGRAYGPLWWVLLPLALAGLLLAGLTDARRLHRALGLVGVVTLVAYVFTPQWIGRGSVAGSFLVYNLRYASPALLIGLVLLPLVPLVGAGRRAWWALAGYGLVSAITQLDPTIWPIEIFEPRFDEPVAGVDSAVGLLIGGLTLIVGAIALAGWGRFVAWRSPAAFATAGLVLAVGGFGLQQFYLDGRYTDIGLVPRIYDWARDIKDERIAVAGAFVFLQYPLYGEDLSNHVQYVAKRGSRGAIEEIRMCSTWRRALNAGHYSYVLTGPVGFGSGHAFETWTARDPAARLVMRERDAFALFRLRGRLDPAGCSG